MSRSIFALALLVAACAPDAVTRPPPISAPNAAVGQGQPTFIVQLAQNAGDPPVIAAALMRQYGGELRRVYRHALKGFAAQMSQSAADALLNNPMVDTVEADGVATLHEIPWGLDRIDQRALPLDQSYTAPNTGTGVNVYVIDTGIRLTHSEFGGRALFGADFSGFGPGDCHGHGTHVSGTVGGATYGVAKSVTLVSVNVFGCSSSSPTSTIIAGVDWVTGNALKPAVANMSLGGGFSQIMNDAVAASIASGISYSISAGNSNANACNVSPASTPEAITVGATDINDVRASFSNYGSCLDIFAPGVSVLSAGAGCDNCTATFSGTSMSAPHVAGAAVLYQSANPGATPPEVSSVLTAAATPGVVIGPGSGSPNRLLFVDWTGTVPPPPPPPDPNAAFTISCSANAFCTFHSTVAQDGTWCFSDWERFGSGGCFGTGATYTRAMSTHDPVTGKSPYVTIVRHIVGSLEAFGQVRCNRNFKCQPSW